MKATWKKLAFGVASAGLLTLYGCGGGDASNAPIPAALATGQPSTVTLVTTADVPVTVVDGPIRNATVCLDKNANGVCDAGEPSGQTDASGKTTLKVDSADVGKFAILAVAGPDAVDMDRPTTPITTPFTMTAPADKPAVVSPLTTLVQTLVKNAGLSPTAAEAQLKEQTGLNVSLFEDFTKSTTPDSQSAGVLARMLVVTTQQQSDAIKSTVGTPAIDGTTIKASDIDRLVQARLIEILSNIVAAANDPAITTASTPAAKEAAIQAQTTTLLANPSNAITTSSVATLVGISNAAATTTTAVVSATVAPVAAVASLGLSNLNFTDVSNWFSRVLTATVQQNTPDSAGNVKFVDRRASSVAGQVASWGTGNEPRRQSDLAFNGTAWINCPLNFENTSTVTNAAGNSNYSYCNRETGTSNRANFDVSGKTMASVYQQVRDGGYTNLTIANAATALGSVTFPAGSTLRYQTTTPLSSVNSYYPGTDNTVKAFSTAVSAGGLASSQAAGVGCNASEFTVAATAVSTSLEAMVASMTGTPCVFNPVASFVYNSATYTNPDPTTEAWGNSTVSVGTLGTAPVNSGVAPGFYTSNQLIRVAFKGTGTNPVTYYSCKQRFNNGSTRNCSVIGTGNYTIATQGDARVMMLGNPPAAIAPLGYQRVFVERGSKVFFGYKNNLTVTTSARLNKTATDALFVKLELPAINPDVPVALSRTSYAGDWFVASVATPLDSTLLRISASGAATCVNTNATVTPPLVITEACTVTFTDLATGAITSTTPSRAGTSTGTLNFLTGAVTGTFTPTTGAAIALTGARR